MSDRRRQLVQDMQQIERVSRLGKKAPALDSYRRALAALDQDIETRRRQLQVQQAAPFTEINLRRTALEQQIEGWSRQEKRLEAEQGDLEAERRFLTETASQAEKLQEALAAAEAVAVRAGEVREQVRSGLPQAVLEDLAEASPTVRRRWAWAAALATGCGLLIILCGFGWQELHWVVSMFPKRSSRLRA